MIRQALVTTPQNLRKLADDLEKENIAPSQRCIVSIINKTPKCSDTWIFEK